VFVLKSEYELKTLRKSINKISILVIMEKISNQVFKKLERKSMSAIRGGDSTRCTKYTSGSTGMTVCDEETLDNDGKVIARRITGMYYQSVSCCDTVARRLT
jgi:hypothetical protein